MPMRKPCLMVSFSTIDNQVCQNPINKCDKLTFLPEIKIFRTGVGL